MNASAWTVTLAATALLALAQGLRAASGLFVTPLEAATGLGLAMLSLLFGAGQFAQGLAQPVLGALADRRGAAALVAVGAVVLASATALPTLSTAPAAVALAIVLGAVASGAAGSSATLIGEVHRAVAAARVGLATGIVGAGGPLGQLLFGPLTQHWIASRGWPFALQASAGLMLLALPLALALRRPREATARVAPQPIADALRDRRFWLVTASFAACGFHVGFLGAHMPGVIERCGLPAALAGTWIAIAGLANAAGSVAAGQVLQRIDAGRLLAAIYGARALAIVALLAVAPTSAALLAFALAMGVTHMAALPPTAALIARHHGAGRLGALFGVVMLVHQAGSFAGIWLGGTLAWRTRSDTPLWCIDIALALAAATLAYGQRERSLPRRDAGSASAVFRSV